MDEDEVEEKSAPTPSLLTHNPQLIPILKCNSIPLTGHILPIII